MIPNKRDWFNFLHKNEPSANGLLLKQHNSPTPKECMNLASPAFHSFPHRATFDDVILLV